MQNPLETIEAKFKEERAAIAESDVLMARAMQQARCPECDTPLTMSAKHAEGCQWFLRQCQGMQNAFNLTGTPDSAGVRGVKRIGRFLCRIGLHRWAFAGIDLIPSGSYQECKRCKKVAYWSWI